MKWRAKGLQAPIRLRLEVPAVVALTVLIFPCVTGCTGAGPGSTSLQPVNAASSADVAVRSAPVVAGRRARVFIFAGLGEKCEPIAAPQIAITEPPSKGDVTLVPGQETTIEYSAQGTCLGRKATGTGIYYTARAGQLGADRFSVSAKLASGEIASRTFEVTIAE
jgi:hypothetical protein